MKHFNYCFPLIALFALCSCGQPSSNGSATADTLTEAQTHLPENALKGLTIADGLEVTPIATEPMLRNPTNIDVDEKGRVWVTEAYNYRPAINGNPVNEKGDRIIILEDTNGDGRADTAKLFYQGPELNAPLGICVLGKRVLVSQSPYIWSFYDDDGDDKADRKEILFQGIGGEQHDHGAHAFTFGPDGKLYFNFGNEGKTLLDKNGKTVIDQDGDEIGPRKYKQGMIFRCDPDGSNVECLANNFRNNYEVAVDSYGTLWQSDNDDDGNRSVRINYVMEYGNYGYTDEMTGAGWRANRTNLEDSTPLRHWHLNDPGVIPNLLQTGAGSPTGMISYEGSLLPESFRGQMIHCDAGVNVVRSYPVTKQGAGYSAATINILKGEKDQWFRPADVCVAPDGSLIIADWYDVGVGGHQAGDQVRGRIYRVAPKDSKYNVPAQDFTTAAGAVKALQSPNLSTRYHAWTVLQEMGDKAIPELEKLWKPGNTEADPRMRARALWVLVKMPGVNIQKYIQEAIHDTDGDLRITGIRAASQLQSNLMEVIKSLSNDNNVSVRRACAIALHHQQSPEAPALWTALATRYPAGDRWYLEALGIGADGQWDQFFTDWLSGIKDPLQTAATRDIVWRARTEKAVPFLAQLASQETFSLKERLRYFRAFDFNSGPSKSDLLLAMITNKKNNDTAIDKLVLHHLDMATVRKSAVAQKALNNVLLAVNGTPEYIELVNRYELRSENKNLLQLSIDRHKESLGGDAARYLLKLGGESLAWQVINAGDTARANALLKAISRVGNNESVDIIQKVALSSKYPASLRETAARNIGRSGNGEDRVLELLRNKKVPASLLPAMVASVSNAWRKAIIEEAASYLPGAVKTIAAKIPTMEMIKGLKTNAAAGKTVYTRLCAVCHQVNKEGNDFGPALTVIGSKYPKDGLLKSIVYPSEGIGFGYEGWQLELKDGSSLSGIIASKTSDEIELKLAGGTKRQIKQSEIKSTKQLKTSLMPEGLHGGMSVQEVGDLVEYLSGLK
ncbi:MAG: PVC-type heme-binding CxxCH protein [Chitinophagaceae bacterium]